MHRNYMWTALKKLNKKTLSGKTDAWGDKSSADPSWTEDGGLGGAT